VLESEKRSEAEDVPPPAPEEPGIVPSDDPYGWGSLGLKKAVKKPKKKSYPI
jgi:hypothetical protein